MIKFVARGKDRTLLGLGITDGNIQRLREGKPIHVSGEEVGLSGVDVTIIWGKDEASIAAELEPFIGHSTAVTDDRKRKKQ